jgi:hypothetical protein
MVYKNRIIQYLKDNFKDLHLRQEDKDFYVLERPKDQEIEDFITEYLKSESIYFRVESEQIAITF